MRLKWKRSLMIAGITAVILGSVGGCSLNVKKVDTPVVVETDDSAKLKNAESYDNLYAVLAKINKKNQSYSSRYYMNSADFAVVEEKESAPTSSKSDATGTSDYSKTNVQVEGIDEADIIKTDGKYFYILNDNENKIYIVSADGAKMAKTAEITLDDKLGNARELYLSDNRLAVITNRFVNDNQESAKEIWNYRYWYSGKNVTGVTVYDITDRSNPTLVNTLEQDGSYISSRFVGNQLYIFSNHYNYQYSFYQEEDTEFWKNIEKAIPCVESCKIDADCIYYCSASTSNTFVVLTALDINQPTAYADVKSVLADGSHCYVSNNYIYICDERWQEIKVPYSRTEIYRFGYENGTITQDGQFTVKGNLNDQFSMDEYNGYMRIVTTVNEYKYSEESLLKDLDDVNDDGTVDENDLEMVQGNVWWYLSDYETKQYNALYIFDQELKQTGAIENLAENEHIESARLMGDTGYFVTFRQTDPLFSVDLSDPTNPKVLGALKIPGFSEYLHPFGENLLLGIGVDADETTGRRENLKLSMFDISDPSDVKEVYKISLKNFSYTSVSYNHKAVLVDAEKNLIAFPAQGYKNGNSYNVYLVYGFDPETGFFEKMSDGYNWNEMFGNNYYAIYGYGYYEAFWSETRGAYIGNTFYRINPGYEITAYDMTSWKKANSMILSEKIEESRKMYEKLIAANPDPIMISLDSNPTTGYNWEVTNQIGDSIMYYTCNYYPDEVEEGICGAGGVQEFEFHVAHPGKSEVTFYYIRSWEEESVQKRTFLIEVSENYEVTVTEQ